ncbi:MAG: DUF5320 family protein [Deltaproteobacteria bacterium]|nr:DUF5320 family protein [Deltaproteobacteria bacterium]
MKIAITSTGPTLDDPVDPRFGRCAYFVIVEANGISFEAFDNESIALGGGAGIQSAQFVVSKGVDAVITGNCGPKALQTLSAAKVEIFVGQSGTVREVVEKYKRGDIKSTDTPNVTDHYGMESGADMNRRMVKGCGGGMGMDRGMGRGMGSSTLNVSGRQGPTMLSNEERLKRLKDQANELRQQIEDLESNMKLLDEK